MRYYSRLLAGAAFSLLCISNANSSPFPDRALRVIVPYSAGGGADAAARLIGRALSQKTGQPVVIENKPGAGGSIGASAVAAAHADGYTLLFDAASFAINPAIHKLNFDPSHLKPLVQAVVMPDILVVPPKSPYHTMKELLGAAKTSKNNISYASYGVGSSAHMIGELLNLEAKTNMLHVPYKGGAPAIVDLMGGLVSTYFASAASSLQLVQTGRLRALAVTSPQRMPELPNVPTVRELGLARLETMEWNGFFVHVDTPPTAARFLEQAIKSAVLDPEVQDGLKKMGLTPVARGADEFQKVVSADMIKWAQIVEQANIKQL